MKQSKARQRVGARVCWAALQATEPGFIGSLRGDGGGKLRGQTPGVGCRLTLSPAHCVHTSLFYSFVHR